MIRWQWKRQVLFLVDFKVLNGQLPHPELLRCRSVTINRGLSGLSHLQSTSFGLGKRRNKPHGEPPQCGSIHTTLIDTLSIRWQVHQTKQNAKRCVCVLSQQLGAIEVGSCFHHKYRIYFKANQPLLLRRSQPNTGSAPSHVKNPQLPGWPQVWALRQSGRRDTRLKTSRSQTLTASLSSSFLSFHKLNQGK